MKSRTQLYYSGKPSKGFWDRVAKLDDAGHDAMYTLGCALQNLGGDVLRFLEITEDEQRAAPHELKYRAKRREEIRKMMLDSRLRVARLFTRRWRRKT